MDIEWIVWRLIQNDTSLYELKLDLDYYDIDVWERLLIGLRRNKIVTKLILERAESLRARRRTNNDLLDLFRSIKHLNLISLELIEFTILDLYENHMFLQFLDGHITLEKLTFQLVDISTATTETTADNDELYTRVLLQPIPISFLITAPYVKYIKLDLGISTSLVDLFIQNSSSSNQEEGSNNNPPPLEEVTIECCCTTNFTFKDEHIIPVIEALKTNRTLKSFDLEHAISGNAMIQIASMLEVNTTLKKLRISYGGTNTTTNSSSSSTSNDERNNYSGNNEPTQVQVCSALINALRNNTNTALIHFQNYRSGQVLKSGEKQHLQQQQQQEEQTIYNNLRSQQLSMLKRNYTLVSFALFHQSEKNHESLYFKLNSKGGRRKIFQICNKHSNNNNDGTTIVLSSDHRLWVDRLIHHRRDLDCLFYYISKNPTLCKPQPKLQQQPQHQPSSPKQEQQEQQQQNHEDRSGDDEKKVTTSTTTKPSSSTTTTNEIATNSSSSSNNKRTRNDDKIIESYPREQQKQKRIDFT